MRKAIIMRGLPGSGKSTYILRHYPGAIVCSADDYFVRWDLTAWDSYGGWVYRYNRLRLADAHGWCGEYFRIQIERGAELVVVDNTNLYKVLTAGFVNYAAARGYEVEIVRLMAEVNDCHSIHGVPAEQIGFMSMNFQDYPAERIVKREEVSG